MVIVDSPTCPYGSTFKKGCICNLCVFKHKKATQKRYRVDKARKSKRINAAKEKFNLSEPLVFTGKFEEVCPQHRNELIPLAKRFTGQEHTAEDLVQETMLRAYSFWSQFTPTTEDIHRDAKVWLRRIMSNIFYTQYQKDQRRAQATDSYGQYLDTEAQTGAEFDSAFLIEALAKLPEDYREIIDRHYYKGETYNELAISLGIPFGQAQKKLWRARQALRKLLPAVDTATLEATEVPQTETDGVKSIVRNNDASPLRRRKSRPNTLTTG